MMEITRATFDDIPELVDLVQSCYRGEISKKGWTSGADYVDGPRTTPAMMLEDLSKPGAVMLKGLDGRGKLITCAYVEKRQDYLYISMICVHPELQTGGLGKRMMEAVEDFAKENRYSLAKMLVVSRRKELVEWYERRGYRKTGYSEPYPDNKYGKIVSETPLNFIELQKGL